MCVFDGIGVEQPDTKMQMVQHGYLAFVEGRVVVNSALAHVSKADTSSKSIAVSAEDHVTELCEQLKRMADNDKAEILSKTTGGDNDDIAVAYSALYWSACVRAAENVEDHIR